MSRAGERCSPKLWPRPAADSPLYELYRQDTQGSVPERPTRESGTEEPITGVSGHDATAFARWVNDIIGSDTVYRLPNLAEIKDPALSRVFTAPKSGIPPHSVWLDHDSEHSQSELWIPPDSDHPHLIDAAMLANHIKNDIERSTKTLIRLLLFRSIITISVFTRALDRNRDRAFDLDGALDRDRITGSALAYTLTRTLRHYKPKSHLTAEFTQDFIDKTDIVETHYIVPPDILADKVQNGQRDLVNLLGPLDGATPLAWAHQVAVNLRETAPPIFNPATAS